MNDDVRLQGNGWGVFDVGGGRLAVQADDYHSPRFSDDEAIQLAREAGVQCDDDGQLTTTDAERHDVFLDTGVCVTVPRGADHETIRAAALEAFRRLLDDQRVVIDVTYGEVEA